MGVTEEDTGSLDYSSCVVGVGGCLESGSSACTFFSGRSAEG